MTTENNPLERRMVVCPVCSDKLCPKATDCGLECTRSEPKCESCGVPLTNHLGTMGICRQLQESLARERNYREQIDSLLKERAAALARLAVKCECPEVRQCERLWAADHDRLQLEAVDPALAEEFNWGCDTVEHLAVALLAAREHRDELAAALSCYMGKFGNCGPTYDKAKAAVEAVEKASGQ